MVSFNKESRTALVPSKSHLLVEMTTTDDDCGQCFVMRLNAKMSMMISRGNGICVRSAMVDLVVALRVGVNMP